GKFAPGNRVGVGHGNPFAKRTNELRRLLLETVSEDDLIEVIRVMVGEAKAAKPWAVKELLDRLLGKPAQAVQVTDADGQPLAIRMTQLTSVVLGALSDNPESRLKVAGALQKLALHQEQGKPD